MKKTILGLVTATVLASAPALAWQDGGVGFGNVHANTFSGVAGSAGSYSGSGSTLFGAGAAGGSTSFEYDGYGNAGGEVTNGVNVWSNNGAEGNIESDTGSFGFGLNQSVNESGSDFVFENTGDASGNWHGFGWDY